MLGPQSLHIRSRDPRWEPRRGFANGIIFFLLLAALIAAWIAWATWPSPGTGLNAKAQRRPVEPRTIAEPSLEQLNIRVYQNASPSLVQVTSIGDEEDLFGLNVQEVPEGVGSGFVWDTDGHIVTAYHVVEGAEALRVTLSDHSVYDAQKVWGDEDQDIAVIWIHAPKTKLHAIPIGVSHSLKVGQLVYALGDPFGLAQTMTSGIVSALGREMESSNGRKIRGVIQTSAPINPGNSGGPLLDSSGRLIGMNTAIITPSGAFAGIGFAVPVDEIDTVVTQLIRRGKIVRPHLGVQVAEDQIAQQLGVKEGALVLKVLPNTPAAKAKLRGTRRQDGEIALGDVIVAVNGNAINNSSDLRSAIAQLKPGQTAILTILRNGSRQEVKVSLDAAQ
jgi:S1-C subfamily serine protease